MASTIVPTTSTILPPRSSTALALFNSARIPSDGVALALGGVLTQAFDWRAIFVFQAPVAGLALLALAATQAGAQDYLLKSSLEGHLLVRALRAVLHGWGDRGARGR